MGRSSNAPEAFAKVFAECLAAYGGTKQQLAREIGITPSSLSHLVVGNNGASVDVCLGLAAASGVSASRILRAAGKDKIADLIERLYGAAAPIGRAMSADEQEIVEKFRLVRRSSRRVIRSVIDAHAYANGVMELPPDHPARRLPR
jgi:transcriptional regulator with XRE-family HTH domain